MLHAPVLPTSSTLTALASPSGSTALRTGAAGLAAALSAAAGHWLHLVEYRPGGRWTHLLPSADAAEALHPALHAELAAAQVWLLSWLPGQGTPLHDHGRSAGAFAVVRGTLTERVVSVARAGEPARHTTAALTEGRVRHFGPHHVHQVTNTAASGAAVSVHVYTPGLTRMNTYRIDDGRLERTGTEKAGVDW